MKLETGAFVTRPNIAQYCQSITQATEAERK